MADDLQAQAERVVEEVLGSDAIDALGEPSPWILDALAASPAFVAYIVLRRCEDIYIEGDWMYRPQEDVAAIIGKAEGHDA